MWLDAVLDPGVSAVHSSLACPPHGLRPVRWDRHGPKIMSSRSFVSDSGLHPSPRHTRLSSVSLARHALHYRAVDYTLPGQACDPCGSFLLNWQPLPGYPHLFNYYNVVLFSIFLTMITISDKYIEKFLTKRLVLPGSGTLNLISF